MKNNLVRLSLIIYALLVCKVESIGQNTDQQQKIDTIKQSSYYDHDEYNPRGANAEFSSSFPQNGSIIPYGIPQAYFDFKDSLYNKTGLKIGADYQMLYQVASSTLSDSIHNIALGHWYGIAASWTYKRGKNFEGSFVVSAHQRTNIGNNAVPALFGLENLGSIWTNIEFTFWKFTFENLYWEQRIMKDRFLFRVGNLGANAILNPMRFKDAKTSFTSSPFAFHEAIPYGTFGFGLTFKLKLLKDKELYIVGTLNDMNGDPNKLGLDWSTFGRGEYFYGFEIGNYWKRSKDDYDHLHINAFYADKRSEHSPESLPNKEGWGFRVYGSKQVNKWVAFGGYTFNTAQGGAFGVTLAKQTVTAGVAYTKPINIPGEVALGLMFLQTNDEISALSSARNQYGFELYWKLLLTPNLWLTPGMQLVIDPFINTASDVIAIPHIKFRFAI